MCIIVDANCCHFLKQQNGGGKEIHEWIIKKRGKLATGGKNLAELLKAGLGSILTEYKRANCLSQYSDQIIDAQQQQINITLCKSNDLHVLLLARVSGSRIVFTNDNLLKDDLRNLSLIPKRNGRAVAIYRGVQDKRKLHSCPDCH
jgi:rRNA-processing protein FCF1